MNPEQEADALIEREEDVLDLIIEAVEKKDKTAEDKYRYEFYIISQKLNRFKLTEKQRERSREMLPKVIKSTEGFNMFPAVSKETMAAFAPMMLKEIMKDVDVATAYKPPPKGKNS